MKIDFKGVNCSRHRSDGQAVYLSKIRNTTFQGLKGSKTRIPPLPLQDVAGVNTAPITAVVTAGKAHGGARAPAAVLCALPVTSFVLLSWKQTQYEREITVFPR